MQADWPTLPHNERAVSGLIRRCIIWRDQPAVGADQFVALLQGKEPNTVGSPVFTPSSVDEPNAGAERPPMLRAGEQPS
jgi:hypothetical protein